MQRLTIHLLNSLLLIIILIGIPAITSARLGSLQLSSAPKAQKLTLWGLGLTAAFNSTAAIWFTKKRKDRMLCCKWAAVFGALLTIEYLYFKAYFNFDWLKEALQWLQKLF